LIWGDEAGEDPLQASNPDLRFDTTAILDTMEFIFEKFRALGFPDESAGTNLGIYKVPIIMLNTFGNDGVTGWAFGGDPDGIMGTFWAHPLAMHDGGVAAHEFTHSLQAQTVIDYRNMHGAGPVWLNAGIFWETHANFMRNLLYPQAVSAWGMDWYHIETWGDWKNTYENYPLLMAIMESDGMDIINRLWRESQSDEYPLQTYKRLSGFSQEEFNDHMFAYARRMATYDFTYHDLGKFFRQARRNDLMYNLASVQSTWTILKKDSITENHFYVPIELAPEEYAYNVIPVYPEEDSCAVIVHFKGHTEANAHTGWRYGFVTADENGLLIRYSDTYSEVENEIGITLEGGETQLFLVIMGAPSDDITTNTSNDTWHGYPKHFRFPYEISITGGVPEGSQAPGQFRSSQKSAGHLHPNGGGWIEHDAEVAPSVYVGPYAMVLGTSQITDDVRIEGASMINNAFISDHVIVRDNALVTGGLLSGHAIIGGQSFVENATVEDNALVHMRARVSNYYLHGDIEVGGDVIVYNASGDCDNGVYYRLTNYYDDKLLECDDRTADHPDNKDVNEEITPFSTAEVQVGCDCVHYPDCLVSGVNNEKPLSRQLWAYPNPVESIFTILIPDEVEGVVELTDGMGRILKEIKIYRNENLHIDLSSFPSGWYLLHVKGHQGDHLYGKVFKM
jgi:carbonic anhydrase/acetyltransferase-like protein (isoleucine patch superfamily)